MYMLVSHAKLHHQPNLWELLNKYLLNKNEGKGIRNSYPNSWLFNILEIGRNINLVYKSSRTENCLHSVIFFHVVKIIPSKINIYKNNSTWEVNNIALKC